MSDIFELSSYAFNPHGIAFVVSGVILLILGSIVFLHGPKNKAHISFFITALTVIWWLLAHSIIFQSTNYEVAFAWAKIMWFGVVLISPSVYFFTVSVLELPNKGKWIFLSYLMFLPFIFAIPFNLVISGVYKLPWYYVAKRGVLEPYFLILFFGQMLWVFAIFYRARLKPGLRLLKRRQIRLIFLAFFFAYFGALDYLPTLGIQWYMIGFIPIVIWISVIAYAILRYRLFAITSAIAAPTIITTMADIILVADIEGRVIITNNSAGLTFGLATSHIIGSPLADFMPTGEALIERAKRLSPQDDILAAQEESVVRTKNNKEIPVSFSATAIRDPAGEAVGLTVICHNIERLKTQLSIIEQ